MTMKPLCEALSLREVQPDVYDGIVHSDYCYGDWAWGGLTASLVQTAAAKTSADKHPDVLNLQIRFLRPVFSGRITVFIHNLQSSKSLSTVHVSLEQKGKKCVLGYVTLCNFSISKGIKFETGWKLDPPALPVNLIDLGRNKDAKWIRYNVPYAPESWNRLHSLVHWFLPLHSSQSNISDQWITPKDPENYFRNSSLGMIADYWTPFIENYDESSKTRVAHLIEIAKEQEHDPHGPKTRMLAAGGWTSPLFITTLSMVLDVKKRLPPSGVKWLFVRAQAKVIANGRFDVEVVIMDEDMEIVALSHQLALASSVPASRNIAKKSDQSKL